MIGFSGEFWTCRAGVGGKENKVMFMGNFGCDAIEEVVLTCDVRFKVRVKLTVEVSFE